MYLAGKSYYRKWRISRWYTLIVSDIALEEFIRFYISYAGCSLKDWMTWNKNNFHREKCKRNTRSLHFSYLEIQLMDFFSVLTSLNWPPVTTVSNPLIFQWSLCIYRVFRNTHLGSRKIMNKSHINICPICLRLWDIMNFINRANSSKPILPVMVYSIFIYSI